MQLAWNRNQAHLPATPHTLLVVQGEADPVALSAAEKRSGTLWFGLWIGLLPVVAIACLAVLAAFAFACPTK